MRPEALADTGFLLALLDADDAWHERCVRALRDLRLPLATSTAVLTELFHLVGDDVRQVRATWRLVRAGPLVVLPLAEADLDPMEALMARYADRPMNFADASLVRLASREGISCVATIDNDDFETYRFDGKRRFRIVPGRPSGRRG